MSEKIYAREDGKEQKEKQANQQQRYETTMRSYEHEPNLRASGSMKITRFE